MTVSVNLVWANGSAKLASQIVEVSEDGTTFTTLAELDKDARAHNYAPELEVGKKLYYRIVSVGATGLRAESVVVSAEIPGTTDLVAPTEVQVEITE